MRVIVNLTFWLASLLLLFCGLHGVGSHLGQAIVASAPQARLIVELGVWVFSLVATGFGLLLLALLFGRKV